MLAKREEGRVSNGTGMEMVFEEGEGRGTYETADYYGNVDFDGAVGICKPMQVDREFWGWDSQPSL